MKKILRAFFIILTLILLFSFLLYTYAKINLPHLKEKEINEAKISFNSSGVPFIESKNYENGFSALAYPHSIHRRIQMEMMKRFASGTLSEIFGEKYLEIDKVMRLLNLIEISKENYREYPSKILEDYAKIVNETTFEMKKPLLSKLLNLKFEKWEPSDSYLILNLLIFDLNRNLKQELFFLKTAKKISPEVLSSLFHFAPFKKCIGEEELQDLEEIPELNLVADFDQIHDLQHFQASNCFAIGKNLSKTGNPFLLNDPHLSKSFPPNWYLAKVKINNAEICGATIPGIPIILIGHTDKIGWGFTSSEADIIDLKIVENPELDKLQKREEIIKIKKNKAYKFEIYNLNKDVLISKLEEGKPVAVLKFSNKISYSPFEIFKKIYESQSLQNSLNGFKEIPFPLNCIIVDLDGNISHIISGRVPERKGSSGFFPSKKIEWEGAIELSSIYSNETKDFIISANEEKNQIISRSWCAPYRYERLWDLIFEKKLDFKDLREIQRDIYSKQAEKILKITINYMPDGILKEKFKKWNFLLDTDSKTAYLWEIFYYKLFENLLKDELKQFYKEYLKITPLSYPALDEAIFEKDKNILWDDLKTEKVEKMSDIIEKTTKEIENLKPVEWGYVHKLKIGYPFIGKSFPFPGDLNTINLGGFMPEYDFKVTIFPSLRFVVEIKEKPECHFELPGGQSENLFDKNSNDLIKEFLQK